MTTRARQQSPAPSFSTTHSAPTSRGSGETADSNGNITYVNSQYLTNDIENRISGVGTYSGDTSVAQYGYDAGNKRVWRGGGGVDELTFWAPNGQKLATYNVKFDTLYSSGYYLKLSQTWVYFGGKMVSKGALNLSNSSQDKVDLSSVVQDRLGSQNGKFYPYGIERPSASANDTEKFATYTRDAATGLDYAVNRYHQPGYGRFLSPDPYKASAGASDPGSWNRYSYVQGDPVNNSDSSGLLLDRLDCYFCDQPIGFGGSGDSNGRRIQYSDDLDVFYADHTQTADGGWVCNSNIQSAFTTATAYSPGWSCGPPVEKAAYKPTCLDGFEKYKVEFVKAHVSDAVTLSHESGLDQALILGWSGFESGWGTNEASKDHNNFFSYGVWLNLTFSGYYDAGHTALFSVKNTFRYRGHVGLSSINILTDQFSKGASVRRAFSVLAASGYEAGSWSSYGGKTVGAYTLVIAIEDCLNSLGAW